ncbi:MAG: double-strand break repair protein AddB [Hyphomonadaceae bacterium]|nr:double-strand break repair protein AddB [Hyphomonadaceae bacterium]
MFAAGEPRVFSLPPSAAFLDELAKGLIDATGAKENPELLADALIFTPNRRAARELALSLYRAMGGPLLAPEIRALGDLEEEDGLAAFGPDALDLPPVLPTARRRGALAKLVQGWRDIQGEERLPPSSLLSAADELGALIDQAALVGGVDWDKLKGLSDELAPSLAGHWQASASFLDIVMHAWPDFLKEEGACDEQTRRLAAAEALSTRWAKTPPQRPVIIAGSTGAGAATRILMEAVLKLPMGVIVFPGVDPDLTAGSWAAVADAASHPQHVLGETLKWLKLSSSTVRPFPQSEETHTERARRRLFNEALAPASKTSDWTERLKALAKPGSPKDLVTAGLSGLSLVEAEDESEEALVAALLLRETLETKDKTAALVTPEASLARRVAAILERWNIDISPSAGIPLSRTQAGSLLLLLIRWAQDPADPVQLLAVLKHPLARLGRAPDVLQRITSDMERAVLRGPRRDQTLDRLAHRLETLKKPKPEAAQLTRDIDALLYPLVGSFTGESVTGAAAAEATARIAEAISDGPRVWSGKQGAMAVQFLEQLAQLSAAMGPMDGASFPDFAETIMQRMVAAPDAAEHPRIAIWGPLEARLQRRDRMILASLNEGAWPKPAAADAFLNRTLRKQLGLPDPDERIGLSAHDFAQMANAPDVILLRARRVDDKPAVASRWVWRLRTLAAGGLGGRDEAEAALKPKANADPLLWAQALRHVEDVKPAKAPKPAPPADKRALNNFSPSRVVTLIRDPYADYARRVLRLEPLRRVAQEIDALERGSAVHAAVEKFEMADNEKPLDELIVDELLEAGAAPELIELEKPLWVRASRAYLRWSALRKGKRVDFATEKEASITFTSSVGEVVLKAKADRMERLADGTLAVVDFKTGQAKKKKAVQTGLEPQLPLEAAIAARAAFGSVGPAPSSELIYFRMSLSADTMKEENGEPLEFDNASTMDVAEQSLAGLQKLIEQYANPSQAYLSKPRVEFIWSVSDYDRLARRAEWTVEEGEE